MLKDLNGGKTDGVHVYSCEFEPKYVAIATDMIKLAGLDDVVTIVQGKAGYALRKLKADGKIGKIEVLFVDHWDEFYLPDLKLVEELELFREASVVIADNVEPPGAPGYLEYLQAGGGGKDGAVRYKTETVWTQRKADGRAASEAVEMTTVLSVSD